MRLLESLGIAIGGALDLSCLTFCFKMATLDLFSVGVFSSANLAQRGCKARRTFWISVLEVGDSRHAQHLIAEHTTSMKWQGEVDGPMAELLILRRLPAGCRISILALVRAAARQRWRCDCPCAPPPPALRYRSRRPAGVLHEPH